MNILFYGNCQLTPLVKTLNFNNYNPTIIECFNTELSQNEFDNIIKKMDIIIMQPIDDNYRNKTYLSTTYVIYHAKSECKIILLNNFYFDFYYPDNKTINTKGTLNPYHHLYLYECFKTGKDIDFYIQNYKENKNLKTKYELECSANNSLNELNNRYDGMLLHKKYSPHKLIFCISVSEFIKDNYKQKLLFYTINHPSKLLFHYVAEQIIRILNIENTIDYEIDILNHTRCILYKCLQRVVCFDINEHTPCLNQETNIQNIVSKYYDIYKNLHL